MLVKRTQRKELQWKRAPEEQTSVNPTLPVTSSYVIISDYREVDTPASRALDITISDISRQA